MKSLSAFALGHVLCYRNRYYCNEFVMSEFQLFNLPIPLHFIMEIATSLIKRIVFSSGFFAHLTRSIELLIETTVTKVNLQKWVYLVRF
jgi:hypothetical protein